jgi:predicted metal-dependent HD superfamily phosphohydrolase
MELQNILNEFGVKCDVKTILDKWNESHRFYHDLNHLTDLISQINEDYGNGVINSNERKKLIITALFHDVVYEIGDDDNKERSADLFFKFCSEKHDIDIVEIRQMILDTKNHRASTSLSEKFISYDMNICQREINELIDWEKNLRQEYSEIENGVYKKQRLFFLESVVDKYPENMDNLLDLINWVKDNY